MSTGGFYEGGYSAYGGGGSNNASSGYDYQNATGGGSHDAYGRGSIGASSMSYSQSQPMKRPNATSYQQQEASSNGNPNSMNNAMNFWNPTTAMAMSTVANAAATGKIGDVNSQVMIGMAESMGKQFLETGWAKAVPGLERSMVALRVYFAVDNLYVKRKIVKVLFPFAFRDWRRQVRLLCVCHCDSLR